MNGNTIESHQQINANNNLTQNFVCHDAASRYTLSYCVCVLPG